MLNSSLFGLTTIRYRKLFHLSCLNNNLQSYGFVPHSIRHGAATRDHLRGVPLNDILLRGRWLSEKSARRYIQTGPALLVTVKLSKLNAIGDAIINGGKLIHIINAFSSLHTNN